MLWTLLKAVQVVDRALVTVCVQAAALHCKRVTQVDWLRAEASTDLDQLLSKVVLVAWDDPQDSVATNIGPCSSLMEGLLNAAVPGLSKLSVDESNPQNPLQLAYTSLSVATDLLQLLVRHLLGLIRANKSKWIDLVEPMFAAFQPTEHTHEAFVAQVPSCEHHTHCHASFVCS